MSRVRQFARGLSSSWIATLATIIYSVLSIPIALRYLSVEEFGLFVLLLQVGGYLSLIEFGISAATARILIDYKDAPNGGAYGAVIITGSVVFALQASLIVVAGAIFSPSIVHGLGIPTALAEQAVTLLQWLALTTGATIAFRIYGAVLYANKHLDLIHFFMAAGMLLSLVTLAAVLAAGGGLSGLKWVFVAQATASTIPAILACLALGLFPKKGRWGKPTLQRAGELLWFGKDIFLINIGNQVLEASQLVIVTKTMGLAAAAAWSVSTKLFTLAYQIIVKIEATAAVFFGEMVARGETARLALRFRHVYQLSAGIAAVILCVSVCINRSFVSAWADSSLAWPLSMSAVMAAVIFISALTRCAIDLIIHTKNVEKVRYVYFAEAAGFLVLAFLLSDSMGFYGVLIASLVCLVCFRAFYLILRMSSYFQLPASTFWWSWLKRAFGTIFILAPFVITGDWLANSATDRWLGLFLACAWVSVPSFATVCLFILPQDIKTEIVNRWPLFSFLRAR